MLGVGVLQGSDSSSLCYQEALSREFCGLSMGAAVRRCPDNQCWVQGETAGKGDRQGSQRWRKMGYV